MRLNFLSVVGAHLMNHLPADRISYWQEGDNEVDFIITTGTQVTAIEVKSGRPPDVTGTFYFPEKISQRKKP